MDKVPAHPSKMARLDGNENGRENTSPQEEVEVPLAAAKSDFPEEVLEKIFSKLDSAKDIHAASNTSDQFNRILEPTKTIWAFDSVFPELLPYLDKKSTLECRMVCKKWCQVIDKDLQSRPDTRVHSLYPVGTSQQTENDQPLYAPRFRMSLISKNLMELKLHTSSDIRNFMEKMGDHSRNPLILRSVSLHNEGASEDYWELVLSFLERFGIEIWHVSISSFEMYDDLEDRPFMLCSYDLLVRILGHLTNLKSLWISGVLYGHVNRPFPALPHLQILKQYYDCNDRISEPQVFDDMLRTYSSQLQILSWLELSVWKRHRTHFPNLPQVKHIFLIAMANLRTWRQFCSELVAPNLAKLTLILQVGWSVSKLLQPLARGFPSLEYLKLRFNSRPDNFRSQAPPKFLLENVKTLEVDDNPAGEVPYNQLFMHMPRLEYLLVCHYQTRGPNVSFDDPTQWNLFKWINGPSIENSDIWTRLTSLKELTLGRMGDAGNGFTEYEIRARKTFTRKLQS